MTTPEPQSGQQKARIDPHAKNTGRERDTIDRNDQDQQRRMGSARGHATRIDYLARPGVRQPTDPQHRQ